MSSDSDSDEDLARLKEAVDTSTLTESLFNKADKRKEDVDKPSEVESDVGKQPEVKEFKANYKSAFSFKRSVKPVIADGKPLISLRRDKQREDEGEVMSDLEVTPSFRKFVAAKLDELVGGQLEEVEVVGAEVKNSGPADWSGVRLTMKSKRPVREGEEVAEGEKRKKPSLLAHRVQEVGEEEVAACAVSGQQVRSRGLTTLTSLQT